MTDQTPADSPNRPRIARAIQSVFLLLIIWIGLLLVMAGLGRETPLLALSFDAAWMPWLLVAVGALLLGDAVRSLVLVSLKRPPPDISPGAPASSRRPIRWRAILRLLVAAALLGVLVPGTSLGIVEIQRGAWALWLVVGLFGVLGGAGLVLGSESIAQAARLFGGEGIKGVATIERVADTGWRINDNPRVRLDLTVSIDGQPSYRAQVADNVPLVALGRLLVGGTLPVLVHPDAPQDLVILWDE